MVFYPSPPTRAANFSNTEFSRECSKLRFGNRCAPLKCETVGQTAENVYIRGREGRGEGGMSTRCMYDGDKAHPPIMLSFSLRFLSPLFFSIVRFSLVLLALDISWKGRGKFIEFSSRSGGELCSFPRLDLRWLVLAMNLAVERDFARALHGITARG